MRAAFFDVDETLLTGKSMFEFLRFWLARCGDDGTAYEREAAAVRELSARGMPREDVNRAFYSRFAGADAAEVRAAGRDWYARYRARPGAFVTAGVEALAAHRAAGDVVVLVSGSFPPALDPVAGDLGADRVLCTTVDVGADGRFTGTVTEPMIGAAKAEAVAKTAAELGVSIADCWGYGDHASDLGLLRAVGHPVVIGGDPVLTAHAREHGWPVLSQAGGGRGRP